ncbi:MAG: M23 family metallopeptidase [Sphingobacteriales bacterium]|nr:M23 family metallopeptidase [Sphingobacteriales bacterium]
MSRLYFFVLLVLCYFDSHSQEIVPGFLKSPVPIPVYISGSFSELRNNHFHGGIDIRTDGRIGLPVVAPADGYVSRITIEAGNYGKTVFIEHPSGITTVYAHLDAFSKELTDYVYFHQKAAESYEVDLTPEPGKFPVKQGDTFAYSGNSGASRSPHLHFEVREGKSNWVINPLLYGLDVKDDIPPVITGIRLYPVGENSAIEIEYKGKSSTYTRRYFNPVNVAFYKSGGTYRLSGVKMVKVYGNMGIAIECRDMMNDCGNVLDIYKGELTYKGNTIFAQERQHFSLDDTRYINAHCDYYEKYYHGRNFQRFFLLPNNKISFYTNVENNGLITGRVYDTGNVELRIWDHHLNNVAVEFQVTGTNIKPEEFPVKQMESYLKLFYYDRPNYYSDSGIELFFPENSFYENVNFVMKELPARRFTYSGIYKIHKPEIPLQTAFTLRLKADRLPVKYYSKALVAEVSGESVRAVGGVYTNGWVEAKVKNFGSYAVVVDSVAPVVRTVNFVNGSNLKYAKDLKVSIYDLLSGIKSYKAYIDGEWILMEYDKKKGLLTHRFTTLPDGNEHSFRIIVIDNKDNVKEINLNFKR